MSDPLQNLEELEEAFVRDGVAIGPYREMISRTQQHLRRYAELEIQLLDHVSFPVPLDMLQTPPRDMDHTQIEDLAAKQRNRLRETDTSLGGLMTSLDRDGLKVYCPPFPEGTIQGFFLFDGEVGPVMVAEAGLSVPAANGVFARLFGHYLLDSDPYRICLLRKSHEEDTPAMEFGAAFLMGRRMVDGYLAALKEGGAVTPQTVLQLAAYFEATPAMVVRRLLTLGRLDAKEAAALGGVEDPTAAPGDSGAVSERFTRLALEAHARGILTLAELSEHLETEEPAAQGFADRFQLTEAVDPGEAESD